VANDNETNNTDRSSQPLMGLVVLARFVASVDECRRTMWRTSSSEGRAHRGIGLPAENRSNYQSLSEFLCTGQGKVPASILSIETCVDHPGEPGSG